QERGSLFIGGGGQGDEGEGGGGDCRDNDPPGDGGRGKKMTNIPAGRADKSIILKPPRGVTLGQGLGDIAEGERVEVTPRAIRLRKMLLKESDRRKYARQAVSG